jgi:cytochrome c oxidase subunit IV
VSAHIVPIRVYVAIFAVLLVLTGTTTAAAFLDLGPLNTMIMLAIAVTKATLVVLYFMHVRYSSRLTWLVLCGGFAWLLILIVITTNDMVQRGSPRESVSASVR